MNLIAGTTLKDGTYLINHVSQHAVSLTLRGTQVSSSRPVVLKTLKPQPPVEVDSTQIKQRFSEQIQQFSHCRHPALEQLVDVFEESGIPFAVMDYTAGQSLFDYVQTQGCQSVAEALRSIQQVGSALTELHQHGLLHLQVTPHAIIRPIGATMVVLIDMGLDHPTALGWTERSANFLPAGAYVAPEQCQMPASATPATDVYSLAGTLYFLVTGHAPTPAPLRHRDGLPSPRQFCPTLSSTLEAAILWGLELDPGSRPPTIATWLSRLVKPEAVMAHPALPDSIQEQPTLNGASSPSSFPETAIAQPKPVVLSQPSQKSVTQSFTSLPQKSAPPRPLAKALVSVGLVAATVGVTGGLMLRLAAGSTGSGSSFFHSEQSFPPLQDWPGESVPAATIPDVTVQPKTPQRSRTVPADIAPLTSTPRAAEQPLPPDVAPLPDPTPQYIAPSPSPAPSSNITKPAPAPVTPTPDPAAQKTEPPPPPSTPAEAPAFFPTPPPVPRQEGTPRLTTDPL